jgi:hypothetical protein
MLTLLLELVKKKIFKIEHLVSSNLANIWNFLRISRHKY